MAIRSSLISAQGSSTLAACKTGSANLPPKSKAIRVFPVDGNAYYPVTVQLPGVALTVYDSGWKAIRAPDGGQLQITARQLPAAETYARQAEQWGIEIAETEDDCFSAVQPKPTGRLVLSLTNIAQASTDIYLNLLPPEVQQLLKVVVRFDAWPDFGADTPGARFQAEDIATGTPLTGFSLADGAGENEFILGGWVTGSQFPDCTMSSNIPMRLRMDSGGVNDGRKAAVYAWMWSGGLD